jgi:hypothetical protein
MPARSRQNQRCCVVLREKTKIVLLLSVNFFKYFDISPSQQINIRAEQIIAFEGHARDYLFCVLNKSIFA